MRIPHHLEPGHLTSSNRDTTASSNRDTTTSSNQDTTTSSNQDTSLPQIRTPLLPQIRTPHFLKSGHHYFFKSGHLTSSSRDTTTSSNQDTSLLLSHVSDVKIHILSPAESGPHQEVQEIAKYLYTSCITLTHPVSYTSLFTLLIPLYLGL